MQWIQKLAASTHSATHSAQTSSSSRSSLTIHWILPNQLAIGRLPRSGESQILSEAGIDHVLSLCAQAEGVLPLDVSQTFRCQRFILPDSDYLLRLNTRHLDRAVQILNQCFEARHTVYVHCLAGVERSPTLCVAYLCLHHDFELWEAVTWVKQVHPPAMLTDDQIQVIRDLIQHRQNAQLRLSNDDLLC
ncbi:MAG: protein-tyrosine phosphatase family protein [Elainellaceae cyanobacterium]